MRTNGSQKGFLVAVLGIAFLLRVVWILRQDNTVNVWTDWWDELAWNLATGRGYTVANPFLASGEPYYSWRPPLFPLFLAGIYALFGHSYLAAKLALAVVSTVCVFLVYRLSEQIFSRQVARLACSLTAVYPTFIFFTGYLAPETLTMCCLLGFLTTLMTAVGSRSQIQWAVAGLWLGACILCRTIMVLFFVFVLAWMLLQKMEKKYVVVAFTTLVTTMLLTISPWVVRNWRFHGVFLLHSTDSGQALYINNNPESFSIEPSGTAFNYDPEEVGRLSELEATRLLSARAIAFIRSHPVRFACYVWRRLLNFWRPFPYTVSGPGKAYTRAHQVFSLLYTGPVFLLSLVGILASRKQWRRISLVYFLMVYYSGTYILVRAIIRYRMPLEPLLVILAAYGWLSLFPKPRELYGKMHLL